jgi:putative transcriptional regulator
MKRSTLKNLRKSSKLTVPQIAEKANISNSYYYKIESGLRNPTLKLAEKIANILKANPGEIFFENQMDATSN